MFFTRKTYFMRILHETSFYAIGPLGICPVCQISSPALLTIKNANKPDFYNYEIAQRYTVLCEIILLVVQNFARKFYLQTSVSNTYFICFDLYV